MLFIIAAPRLTGQADRNVAAWGDSANGLQMALSLGSQQASASELPQLNLALRNLGTSEIKVPLGGGCGVADPTNAVLLLLTDDQGKSHELHDKTQASFCAGAAFVNIITLAPGQYYSTALDLHNYLSLPGQQVMLGEMAEPIGLCRLRATIDVNFHSKTNAISNEVQIEFR